MDRAFKRAEDPPPGMLGYGDYDTALDVAGKALAPGPYLMGDRFTAADVVLGSQLRWGTLFKLIPERPDFAPYIARLAERPEAIDAPFMAG